MTKNTSPKPPSSVADIERIVAANPALGERAAHSGHSHNLFAQQFGKLIIALAREKDKTTPHRPDWLVLSPKGREKLAKSRQFFAALGEAATVVRSVGLGTEVDDVYLRVAAPTLSMSEDTVALQ